MSRQPARLRRTTVAFLAAAAAPFIGLSAANAAEITVVDSTGDVRTDNGEVDPTLTNGDFTQVTYGHRLHRIVIDAEYVDLQQPTADGGLFFATRMRTNEDAYRVAFTFADSSEPGGESFLGNRRREVRCRGLAHDIDYQANTIRLVVPRSCISRPRWVRFTSAHSAFDGVTETFDHPHDNGAIPTAWTSKVRHD